MATTLKTVNCTKPSPLVKWAGGKRQLLPDLLKYLPPNWNCYWEPFVGGGALLIKLGQRGLLDQAVISDMNISLYNLYVVVKDRPQELITALEQLPFNNNDQDYYQARELFNSRLQHPVPDLQVAALLLYLNRHCYNGLWRVNAQGEYNVPFGRYKLPKLPGEEAIMAFSRLLQKVEVYDFDFEVAVKEAGVGDFVYFDPPYQPVSGTAYFTHYTASGFSDVGQERLAHVTFELDQRGVQVMVSNSDTPLIRKLYSQFNIHPVTARRAINSNPGKRAGAAEVIITNY